MAAVPVVNQIEQVTTYEYVIIGGGPSGIYFYDKLLQKGKGGSAILFEKQPFKKGAVGRLQSDSNDETNHKNKDELGGMRIYPSKMPEVANLAKRVGCNLVWIDSNDSGNYFYFKGKRFNKEDFKTSYRFSSGRNMKEVDEIVFGSFEKQYPNEAKNCMKSKFLCSMTKKEFYLKFGATEEEMDAITCYSGYEFDVDSAAVMFFEDQFLGSDMAWDHNFIVEGYGAIFQRLAEKMNIKYGSTVTKIEKLEKGFKVHACDAQGMTSVIGENIVLALAHNHLVQIVNANPNLLEKKRMNCAKDSVSCIPGFKAFLEWDEAWWLDAGFKTGKSTTDLDIRQLHYYDSEDIMIYNYGKYAANWGKLCKEDPQKAARLMVAQIREIHSDLDIPDPKYSEFIWKLHENEHLWNPDFIIDDCMKEIVLPGEENNKVFIVGDAWSNMHGWVCGALASVDLFFEASVECPIGHSALSISLKDKQSFTTSRFRNTSN